MSSCRQLLCIKISEENLDKAMKSNKKEIGHNFLSWPRRGKALTRDWCPASLWHFLSVHMTHSLELYIYILMYVDMRKLK